ncbi:MAG: class I SAM-dependent methyltransferase [Bacteroidetes bacterium]|nr:class I SAM-dependent methyltransferase [Bacteroidota bacterium]
MQKEAGHFWYSSWFDSPYYHILYMDRDNKEAENFMDHLIAFLELPEKSEILDLACGKGRHSVYLNKLGYRVVGADLSATSILHAKQFENETLQFIEHDMSLSFQKKFDAIFNLFTSFGYFEDEEDNLRTLKAIKAGLKDNGCAVIDFLNSGNVIKNLVPNETKVIDDITFHIEKYLEDDHFIKNINFTHGGKEYDFTEKVRALTLKDFLRYFNRTGIMLKHCFGDYQLNDYNEVSSERLILIFN